MRLHQGAIAERGERARLPARPSSAGLRRRFLCASVDPIRLHWISNSISKLIASVKQSKTPHETFSPGRVRQPVGVTLIGLYMLFGACLMPVNMYAHAPAFVFGFSLHASPAGAFFAAMCLLDAAIGFNLLMLVWWSRIAAIWFFAFRIANTCATLLVSNSRHRFEQSVLLAQRATGLGPVPTALRIRIGALIEICIMTVAICVLLRNKASFLSAGSPAAGEDSATV